MSLRLRLLLGYGYLVLLIVLAAGGSAVGFFDLSRGIDRILDENVRSLGSATEMLGALERQDSVTLAALVRGGADDELREDFDRADASFNEALEAARANITIDGERALLERIDRDYDTYIELREELIAQPPSSPLAVYHRQTHPRFDSVRTSVIELIEMNREAIAEADRQARQTALQNGVWLGVLVTIALLSLVLMSRALKEQLLARLTYFNKVIEAIAAGDTRRRLQVRSGDELGTIARHFNAAVDTQEELRAEAQGRLNEQRQLLLGVLDHWSEPVALLGLDASVIASTMDDDTLDILAMHSDWVREDGRALLRDFDPGDEPPEASVPIEGGGEVHFRLLVAKGMRPVGWLCSFG
ncbi:MAG: HAMP domain-containing protein [Persicimonas sp.]